MSKAFKFLAGMDISITLSVDTDVMTSEMAAEINAFWSGADEVLEAADGDVIEAVARRAAPRLIHSLVEGWTQKHAVELLSDEEGWPSNHGITIIDFDLPDWSAENLEVERL